MYFHKTGLPEEGDLLLCTVTNIQYSSVFVNIDDYNISGMVHISEIAAGRIRNIRDYVKEGKKVVCKVLKVHVSRGHVDLSLRRVNDNQRRNKVNEIKLEQKAESIIDFVAKQNKTEGKSLYKKIAPKIFEEYDYIHHAFEDIVESVLDLKTLGIDEKIASEITELVIQRFKPKIIEITGTLTLATYAPNGVEIIKQALELTAKYEGVEVSYLGGGKYRVVVSAPEYKEAEPKLKEATDVAIEHLKKHDGVGIFKRKE